MEHRSANPWPFRVALVVLFAVGIGLVAWKQLSHAKRNRDAADAAASEVAFSLARLRNAIDLYYTEHQGKYPVGGDGVTVEDLLTKYSSLDGLFVGTRDTSMGRVYGPYIDEIPPIPVGVRKGGNGIGTADAPGIGWIMDPRTGSLTANSVEKDRFGRAYADY